MFVSDETIGYNYSIQSSVASGAGRCRRSSAYFVAEIACEAMGSSLSETQNASTNLLPGCPSSFSIPRDAIDTAFITAAAPYSFVTVGCIYVSDAFFKTDRNQK